MALAILLKCKLREAKEVTCGVFVSTLPGTASVEIVQEMIQHYKEGIVYKHPEMVDAVWTPEEVSLFT